jgi:hypothetical protein
MTEHFPLGRHRPDALAHRRVAVAGSSTPELVTGVPRDPRRGSGPDHEGRGPKTLQTFAGARRRADDGTLLREPTQCQEHSPPRNEIALWHFKLARGVSQRRGTAAFARPGDADRHTNCEDRSDV